MLTIHEHLLIYVFGLLSHVFSFVYMHEVFDVLQTLTFIIEVIAYIRGNTGLSVRKMAELLGINRGSVQRALLDRTNK